MSKIKLKYSLKEVSEMLKGEHSSQTKKTFGFSDIKPLKKDLARKVGETWEELDDEGNVKYIWTQHEGYRTKSYPEVSDSEAHWSWDVYNYPNCEPGCEVNASKQFSRLDKKYKLIYGMCSECAAKYETKLKTSGEWENFERLKLLENAKSFFHEADDAIKEAVDRVRNPEFVNENGSIEKWEGSEERAEKMMEEYNMYKNLIFESLNTPAQS